MGSNPTLRETGKRVQMGQTSFLCWSEEGHMSDRVGDDRGSPTSEDVGGTLVPVH